jgi:hypothetical protein
MSSKASKGTTLFPAFNQHGARQKEASKSEIWVSWSHVPGFCAEKRDQTYERNAEGGLKPRNLGSQVPVIVPRKVMEHMDKSLKEASMARVNVWPVIT